MTNRRPPGKMEYRQEVDIVMEPVSYRLIRSGRRTVSLEITRDLEILVRAPQRMPKPQIDAFVESRRS